jgi:glycosyltransferase involved in cell wall biosynthesis
MPNFRPTGIHILLIHQNFAAINEPGGTRHHELALYLAAMGHRVTIVTSPVSYLTGSMEKGSPDSENPPGINILRTYAYAALHRSFFHRVLSFLSFMASSFLTGARVRAVDLVWGTSPPIFQGPTAWSLARLKGVPFVFEVRDLWPAFAIQVGVLRQPFLIRASEWLERFLYRGSDLVIINSPGFRQHVQKRGARQVEIVPNGADLRMFDPGDGGTEFRRQHGLEGKFVALYAGAHGMSNDLGVLLEAASLLEDCPQVAMVLLGDGKDKAALQARALEIGLKNIHFLPPVPKSGIPAALSGADACIAILKPIPLYSTVYPNKVFDYMAAGKPVILAIQGVIQEVIEKAGAGIPVTPGDPGAVAQAVRKLAADPEMGAKMGQQGRQYIKEHFDRPVLADKLSSLFLEMIQSSRK